MNKTFRLTICRASFNIIIQIKFDLSQISYYHEFVYIKSIMIISTPKYFYIRYQCFTFTVCPARFLDEASHIVWRFPTYPIHVPRKSFNDIGVIHQTCQNDIILYRSQFKIILSRRISKSCMITMYLWWILTWKADIVSYMRRLSLWLS